jgi:hypothetical protein
VKLLGTIEYRNETGAMKLITYTGQGIPGSKIQKTIRLPLQVPSFGLIVKLSLIPVPYTFQASKALNNFCEHFLSGIFPDGQAGYSFHPSCQQGRDEYSQYHELSHD